MRSHTVRCLTALLCVIVATACHEDRTPAPLLEDGIESSTSNAASQELPGGWTYIDREGIDSVMGTYHDAKSGVSVKSEEGLSANQPQPWSREARENGSYRMWRGSLGQMPYEQAIRALSSGCDDVIITLAPETLQGRSLNLHSKVCGDGQRDRLRGLVAYLADPSRWPSQAP
jgi:hypothetical protein